MIKANTAKALHLAIPRTLLAFADELIARVAEGWSRPMGLTPIRPNPICVLSATAIIFSR